MSTGTWPTGQQWQLSWCIS